MLSIDVFAEGDLWRRRVLSLGGITPVVPHTYCSREFYFFDYVILGPESHRSAAVDAVCVKVYIFLVSV